MGDKMLFDEYSHCLNLGGFGNVSYESAGQRIAFDICPVNFLLNHLAAKAGLAFDNNGEIAASGEVDDTLLSRLNNLPYYQKKHPKSLGREWVEQEILPLIDSLTMSLSNLMRTAVEHIAMQLSNVFTQSQVRKVLITGGGAYNKFLIQRLDTLSGFRTTLPDPKIIDFKEALIFAFLGLLRMHGTPNCISSVTGAVKNVCGGAIYLP
jgi:anhydro-N-acetylmuramic acid kinase